MVLMTVGVGLVSVLTSSIASALFMHGSKEQQQDVKLIREQLDRMEELLQESVVRVGSEQRAD